MKSSAPNANAASNDFEFTALAEARNYRGALVSEFRNHLKGNVIEIGCGIGQMTKEFRALPEIRRLLSVEPEPEYCRRYREAYPDGELIEGTGADVPSAPWDAILSINVLEHIEDDMQELTRYHQLLADTGGSLCLFVPARPEIYSPIDKDFGHFRRYTRRSLTDKLQRSGFRIARLDYFNSLGYLAWWLNFCLLGKRSFEAAKVRFYDQGIFPFVHLMETKICRPPIGQSLIAIATAN